MIRSSNFMTGGEGKEKGKSLLLPPSDQREGEGGGHGPDSRWLGYNKLVGIFSSSAFRLSQRNVFVMFEMVNFSPWLNEEGIRGEEEDGRYQ